MDRYDDLDIGSRKINKNKETEFIKKAYFHVPIAELALDNLQIPNDISEENREILVSLIYEVRRLKKIIEEYASDSDAEKIKSEIKQSLPIWRKAWEVFVLRISETAGVSAGRGMVFTAGLIAGHLYREFS